jgi:hypothetical protein
VNQQLFERMLESYVNELASPLGWKTAVTVKTRGNLFCARARFDFPMGRMVVSKVKCDTSMPEQFIRSKAADLVRSALDIMLISDESLAM